MKNSLKNIHIENLKHAKDVNKEVKTKINPHSQDSWGSIQVFSYFIKASALKNLHLNAEFQRFLN